MAVVVLSAPEGPTRATSSPGRTGKLTSCRTGSPGAARPRAARRRGGAGGRPRAPPPPPPPPPPPAGEAGDGRLVGGRVAEADVVELDPPRWMVQGDRPGAVADRTLEVEHLEDPLEGHERGHHVHPGVGQGGEGTVDLGDEGGQGDDVTRLQVALKDLPGSEPGA